MTAELEPGRQSRWQVDGEAVPLPLMTTGPRNGDPRPPDELERLRAENARLRQSLHRSERRFQELLDQLPIIAVQGYDQSHRVIFWNRASEQLYGFRREEALGRRLEELIIPPELRPQLSAAIDAWLQHGKPIPAGELSLQRKDGSRVPVFSSHVMQRGIGGQPELYCIDVDLSPLHTSMAELQRTEERRRILLEQRKDSLMREVHHRIKNHLQGMAGLLRQRGRAHPLLAGPLSEVVAQIESIAVVYGLQTQMPCMQIRFNRMLDAIVRSAMNMSDIPLSVIHEAGSGERELDREKAVAVALVINELLTNAIKHFRPRRGADDQEIGVIYRQQAGSILLTVTNPGTLPAGFDLEAARGLGTGLELAATMLPSEGATLAIGQDGDRVVAELWIRPPLLLDGDGSDRP